MPVLTQNIIEIANIAIEIILIYLYFSLLSKRKIGKIPFILSYLLSVVILSVIVLLSDNIFLYLVAKQYLFR